MTDEEYANRIDVWQGTEQWYVETHIVLDKMGLQPGMRVLDFGSATGRTLDMIERRGCEAVGIEPNEEMRCRYAKAGGKALVYRSLPELLASNPSAMFDRALASHVLGHVPDVGMQASRLYWLLQHRGKLAIIVPNVIYDRLMIPVNLFTGYRSDPTLLHDLPLSSIKAMFPASAGRDAEVFYLGEKPTWLPSLMLGDSTRSRLGVIVTKRSA